MLHRRDALILLKALTDMHVRFANERQIAGATVWNAFNSYSGWLQHDKKARGKSLAAKQDFRMQSNLFGTDADRTLDALGLALAV